MTETTGDLSRYATPPGELDYPIDCIVAIVPENQAPALIDAVKAEGISDDEIQIITPDRRDDFAVQLQGGGVKGAIRRFVSSTGGDLDFVTAIIQDLQPGRLGMRVDVGDDKDLKNRVAVAFRQHQGIHVAYLSRQAIETPDGEILG